jgi:acetylornithine deacetylase/succinyl-diaminopimelate desuccinylase-like protein
VPFDDAIARQRIDEAWERDIVPALHDYIAIPAVSPAFDADWRAHGHLDKAVELVRAWCAAHAPRGWRIERIEQPDRTPVLFATAPAVGSSPSSPPAGGDEPTVLLYGHLDKQPPMEGWREGLGPWTPVRDGDRLYGRGGADDGYAAFAAVTALAALTPASRCSSKRARRAAAPTFRPMSTIWPSASAPSIWWCASTPAPATTSGSG